MILSVLIYCAAICLSIYFASLYNKRDVTTDNSGTVTKYTKELFWTLLIISPVVLVATFRLGVGTDYFNYVSWYQNYSWRTIPSILTGFFQMSEPIFILIIRIAYLLFNNVTGFFFIVSLLIQYLITRTLIYFRNELKKPLILTLGLFIHYCYHFLNTFNVMRQWLALALIFYGFIYLYNKKYFHYIIIALLAFFTHNSAIIGLLLLPYMFINNFSNSNKMNMDFQKIIGWLLVFFMPILIIGGLFILPSISIFDGYVDYINLRTDVIPLNLVIQIIIFFPLIFYSKRLIVNNPKFLPFYNIALLNLPFSLLSLFLDVGNRMVEYVSLTIYLLIPLLISTYSFDEDNRKYLKIYYIVFFIAYAFIYYLILGSSEVFPYITIFN